jgi:hypothetical protein
MVVRLASATFFGSIGGSFGVAIFGAIFSNVLVGSLVRHLGTAKLPSGLSSLSVTLAILDKLPPSGPSRHCRRLREFDRNGLRHRRSDRWYRVPRVLAHTSGGSRQGGGASPGPDRTPRPRHPCRLSVSPWAQRPLGSSRLTPGRLLALLSAVGCGLGV